MKEKIKSWEIKYKKTDKFLKGGNANVFFVLDKNTNQEYALKELISKKSDEKRSRFLDEIDIVTKKMNSEKGIIPIIDCDKEKLWYVMPKAKSIFEHIEESKSFVDEIVLGIVEIAETLCSLHSEGITHRDIKPDNILFYNGRYCLSDFGLVDFPDKIAAFTANDKALGAIFTIAPEMKRDPKNADGKPADVYSLAKTLWMLLCRDNKGFDGRYSFLDISHGLRFKDSFKGMHLVELEELLNLATSNNPLERPSIIEFTIALKRWLEIKQDYYKSQESDWAFLKKQLFGAMVPSIVSWDDIKDIVSILKIVASLNAYNHMLFPDKGGLDLADADIANEEGCIYIQVNSGSMLLLKPKWLHYVSFKDSNSWNYFYLELDELKPILADSEVQYEHLVEDKIAHYVDARCVQYGVYDYDSGTKLPEGFKVVNRYCTGSFLILLKSSIYNKINETYDGRHSQTSFQKFKLYMEFLKQVYEELKKQGYNDKNILDMPYFTKNIFKDYEEENEIIISKDYKGSRMYFEEHYGELDFSDLLFSEEKSNIYFYLKFQYNASDVFSILLSKEEIILCKDGKLKSVNKDKIEQEAFLVYSRDAVIDLIIKCNRRIEDICAKNGFGYPTGDITFSFELKRNGKPTHLFTNDEIKELMQNADDRKNNMLVIDENGFAKIIQDINLGFYYPVRLESWVAGNNYVGKYSKLSDLNDTYWLALEGWYEYLEKGKSRYKDYKSTNFQIEELKQKILNFYEYIK